MQTEDGGDTGITGRNVYLKNETIELLQYKLEPYFKTQKQRSIKRCEAVHDALVEFCRSRGIIT